MRRVLSGTLIGGLMLAGSVVATAPSAVADENNSVLSCESDIDDASQGEGQSDSTSCADPVPVLPEIPARVTDCTDPLSQIIMPTTEGVTYSIDEEEGILVAVAEDPYIFSDEDLDEMQDWWFASLPGQRLELELFYILPEDCGDQIRVTKLEAVCDDGIPYIEYAVEAAWANELGISFDTEEGTAQTYDDRNRSGELLRYRMPLEGRTYWPSWVAQDDPHSGPDVEYLPPEDGSFWAELWDGKRIDVYFVPSASSPGYMEGYRYVDSALEYPCNGDTPATPDADPISDPDAPATVDAGPEGDEPPMLAATGATVGGVVVFAALLVLAGGAFIWLRRRALNS